MNQYWHKTLDYQRGMCYTFHSKLYAHFDFASKTILQNKAFINFNVSKKENSPSLRKIT